MTFLTLSGNEIARCYCILFSVILCPLLWIPSFLERLLMRASAKCQFESYPSSFKQVGFFQVYTTVSAYWKLIIETNFILWKHFESCWHPDQDSFCLYSPLLLMCSMYINCHYQYSIFNSFEMRNLWEISSWSFRLSHSEIIVVNNQYREKEQAIFLSFFSSKCYTIFSKAYSSIYVFLLAIWMIVIMNSTFKALWYYRLN